MTTDERGRWFRVYARSVRQHPKFKGMSLLDMGAWLALRSEAELRDKAKFLDREEAALVLRRRGGTRCMAQVDRMISAGLFDLLEDGGVTVHDREDHDRPKYPSDDPEKVKERVKKHRAEKASNNSGNDDETTRYEEGNDTHARASESGAGADSDSSSDGEGVQGEGFVYPPGWDAPDALVAYHDVTGRWPSDKVSDWLDRMANDHPEEAIAAELARQYASDPDILTLLSRTDAALKRDMHLRTRAAEKARQESILKSEEPHRQKEREATPEEREQAALQRQAIRIAMQLGIPVPTEADEVRKFVMKHGSAA
jgi:hypothetical protein